MVGPQIFYSGGTVVDTPILAEDAAGKPFAGNGQMSAGDLAVPESPSALIAIGA